MNGSVKTASLAAVLFLVEVLLFFWLFQNFFAMYVLAVLVFLLTFLGYLTSKQMWIRIATRVTLGALCASAVLAFVV